MIKTFFLHGLESSGKGTKGQFFASNYPKIKCPDFTGNLDNRLQQLESMSKGYRELQFVGSSFGGLMAVCFALNCPQKVKKLILLAPALNFGGFTPPARKILVPTYVVIGKNDNVTPVDPVIQLAEATFSDLTVEIVNDDHMLHKTFEKLAWDKLIGG
ncbi:alpha/beta hydrolase [Desulforhopalus singaporensis]|uniref:Alpha/beta hydrolase family protein n=1 Tax=Desulforhopalus singaporensis TaxID=91360 RepID=A0A1H0UGX9_9BACT|nr:alpha/beta hydrolase [Desulforhopalus singaporensis]SDP65275.1 Alpha/beta hydrolase family protein [Desulforhopalus singaporensis]